MIISSPMSNKKTSVWLLPPEAEHKEFTQIRLSKKSLDKQDQKYDSLLEFYARAIGDLEFPLGLQWPFPYLL